MAKTQTATKPVTKARAKPAPKSKPAQNVAPDFATLFPYAILLVDAIAGLLGMTVQRFYVRAREYHAEKGTSFPRTNDPHYAHALISADDARVKLADIGARNASIGNAHSWSRRLYDEMRAQVQTAAAQTEAREWFAKYETDANARADAAETKVAGK